MKLALFFSFGISARLWQEKGLLEREKLIYEKLLETKAADKICWFTYGPDDSQIGNMLNNGIEIIPIPRILNSKPGIFLYSFLLPFIHRDIIKTVDIFKTNQMYGAWTAVIAKILFKRKLVVRTGYTWSLFVKKRSPGSIKGFMSGLLERFVYSFSDGVIVSSPNDLEYVKEHHTVRGIEKIIPNYIDTDIFKPLEEPKKKHSLCFVGRLTHQKNLMQLLEALKGLPYRLSIIGSGKDRDRLQKYADRNKIDVDFLENVENSKLPALLNDHEVFILPSLYEGTPKALLEAMSCGLPCIGTDVEGIREIIKHGENGYLCSTDPEAIRNAITSVFESKPLRQKIGLNARETVMENFSLKNALEKEAALYRGLSHQPI